MSHYTIEKCLTMAWIVGAHPDMRHNKCQLSIFVALAIGNWITIYLIISLLFYKEDTITIGDFAETFSGMSLVIHGIQRSFSLFFNRKQISEMLQYVRSTFWKESDLDVTDEEKYICKIYYSKLKIAMYIFACSCTSNLFGFCCQTFFSDEDILPLACYKPEWVPFYSFWFLQAEKTFSRAYFSKWYENLKNAQPTKNIILQSQQRVFITAGRLIDINLATSLATVKTMVSYCMFLRTMGVD
ncbi:unnamed protein product [Acanthoscelides obtectus]|uniref:Uncharacterized protein n=1 Tax=Acanthoscelides obtectus TaxID=200917 RepID=A0A9P0LKZ1_ACAOB|nr:unnamed protein product [Acanthoscelides obtectus]CAH2010968.1 unnamed protein product [Acanthoscelides obtectus]CAK1622398.1 hypothetical protein AOBTE_LOCUS1464 [Acanthoscelides obtectus]CAK1622423.1 hypothetical protein AOBTE_LOCUS1471 [Acanthoscelides obtectus]